MSVNTSVYIGTYIKLQDYNIEIDVDEEKYNDMVCGAKGERFSIIYDDMGGQYTYFGITLKKIEDIYGFNKAVISPSEIVIYKTEVETCARELFGIVGDINASCIVFSHSE